MLVKLLILLLLPAIQVYSQGLSHIFILQNEHSIRSSGLAGSFTAVANDASTINYNPAGISQTQIKLGSIVYSHNNDITGWAYDQAFIKTISVIFNQEKIGCLGLDFTYSNQEAIDICNNLGESRGKYTYKEWALSLGYAFNYNSFLSFGTSLKLINIDLEPYGVGINMLSINSTGIALDFGLLYKNFLPQLCLNDRFFKFKYTKYFEYRTFKGPALGISIRNVGPHLEHVFEYEEPLPQQLRIGIAWMIIDTDLLSFQISSDVRKWLISTHNNGQSDAFYKALFTSWKDFSFDQLGYSHGIEITILYFLSLRYGRFIEDEKYGGWDYNTYGFSIGPETLRINGSYRESDNYSFSFKRWQFGFSFIY